MQIYSDKKFTNPIEIIQARGELKQALDKIDQLRQKYYLLGYISYDFQELYFEVYDKFEKYIPNPPKKLGTIINPLISKNTYVEAIKKIKDYISKGITYEVNYTYPSEVLTNLDDIELYEAILEKQKTPYNTFLKTADLTLLSFSPELFFRLEGRKILTKPMKGTAPKNGDNGDLKIKNILYNDVKNRAENIMIVDLLRNDLGRISKAGSVKVDKLFDIEEHPTVFQMTSEISAELEENITLYDIFRSIFPCGSITGAPKRSTMQVIDELEPYKRNIYCGAIGFLSPQMCEFSVPIRILYGKNYHYTYHAGGAIVWDSTPEDEWEETLVKTKFLQSDVQLIETAVDDWENHVKRMKNSAEVLGFKWNKKIETLGKTALLNNSLDKFPQQKLRVTLDKNGNLEYKISDILSGNDNKKKFIKLIGHVNSCNPFLYHKTNIRETMPEDVFEHIRVNEKNEITEGIFTNIAIKKDDELWTPAISCGLLNGTYRQKLIDKDLIKEKVLYVDDLKEADKIFCFNSVRKMVEVELCS